MVTRNTVELGMSVVLPIRDLETHPEWCSGAIGAVQLATERCALQFGGNSHYYRSITEDGRAYRFSFWCDVAADPEIAERMLCGELIMLGVPEIGRLLLEEGKEMDESPLLQDIDNIFHHDAEVRGAALVHALAELERRQREVYETWQQEFKV